IPECGKPAWRIDQELRTNFSPRRFGNRAHEEFFEIIGEGGAETGRCKRALFAATRHFDGPLGKKVLQIRPKRGDPGTAIDGSAGEFQAYRLRLRRGRSLGARATGGL